MSCASPSTGPAAHVFLALADLVDQHYVLSDRARTHADAIRSHAGELAGHLPDIDAANTALRTLVPDRHLCLRPTRPSVVQDIADTPDDARAGGIHQVESLVGGLCLVEFHPVFPAPDRALPALRAAARRAAGSRGLVIDLRRCFGGDTDTAALIHGWLLGPTPIHLGRFEHRGHPSTDYVSDPDVGAHYGAPVRVLTSAGTFSGGEDIAYVQQALGRARVVGEQTCGGAHPVEHFSLPGDHSCQIPVARSVIEATGGNWEGIGVTPDTVCPADRALDHARRELADLDAVPPRHATITETAPTAVPARSRPEW